jgi:hypothetical protein
MQTGGFSGLHTSPVTTPAPSWHEFTQSHRPHASKMIEQTAQLQNVPQWAYKARRWWQQQARQGNSPALSYKQTSRNWAEQGTCMCCCLCTAKQQTCRQLQWCRGPQPCAATYSSFHGFFHVLGHIAGIHDMVTCMHSHTKHIEAGHPKLPCNPATKCCAACCIERQHDTWPARSQYNWVYRHSTTCAPTHAPAQVLL